MGDVVKIRDFKRREETVREVLRRWEREAAADTSPCEMPPVQPSYSAPDKDSA